jgi:hypothetical protein
MSHTVSTLLLRNLHDVFGEIDPVRRRAAIDEIFRADAVFHEPNGSYRGRDEIDRIAGVIEVTHPDFQYQPLSPPEVMGDAGPVRWVSGRAREAKQLAARAARTVQSHDAALWSVAPGR